MVTNVSTTISRPYVLALDIGTSSVRAIVFDSRGREVASNGVVAEAQIKYAQRMTADGGVETDAEALLAVTVKCVKQALRLAGPNRKLIAAVGISCFWHSLVGVDSTPREGASARLDDSGARAITPVYSWADTRSASQVEELRKRFDAADYHARTGCELHPCFWPAKLLWLRETQPEVFRRVEKCMGFGDYVILRLFGQTTMSLSMASGTGLFDQAAGGWDDATLSKLELDPALLPELRDYDQHVSGAVPEFSGALGPLANIPWCLPLGDGACSNAGSGAFSSSRIALNIGTSAAIRVVVPVNPSPEGDPSPPNPLSPPGKGGAGVLADGVMDSQPRSSAGVPVGSSAAVPGLFRYRVDAGHALVGGAFANGGNVHAWLKGTLNWTDDTAMGRAVVAVAPDSHGLTILPFWAGERSPGWHANARAAIAGMNLHTTPAEIVRASLEASAYTFDMALRSIQAEFPEATELYASGGAIAHDSVWAQILADVFGMPMVLCKVGEASSRGAALLALRSIGAIDTPSALPPARGRTFKPNAEHHAVYQASAERFRKLYEWFLTKSRT